MKYRGLSETLLPVARKQIREAFCHVNTSTEENPFSVLFAEDKEKIKIKEVYENYAAAFGMLINQSGFKTAIAIYTRGNSQSEGKRNIILELLFNILKQEELVKENNAEEYFKTIIDGKIADEENAEELLKEASIALKRAIRTFDIV